MTEHSSIRHCLAISLWKTATASPAPTVFAFASGKHQELLDAVLDDAAQLNPAGSEDFDVSTVVVQLRRIATRPTVLIQMPPPFKCPDPHLIALVLNREVHGDIRKSDLEDGTVEFFTLEESPAGPDHPPTMFCSRDADGTHHNHGAGPASNIDAFCTRLTQMYNAKPWWRFW